jgi:DNA repair protein RadC
MKIKEKVIKYSAEKLTIEEILSFLIGTEKKISLEDIYNQEYLLKNLSPLQIQKVKAIKELLKYKNQKFEEKKNITSPENVFYLFQEMQYLSEEHFRIVMLNAKNYIIDTKEVSIGTLNESLVHPREVFRLPIIKSATSIIAVHNHPSGSIVPSEADIGITKRLYETGKIIGIKLLDHVIIGKGDFYSIKRSNTNIFQ